jgi:hypothetical protein
MQEDKANKDFVSAVDTMGKTLKLWMLQHDCRLITGSCMGNNSANYYAEKMHKMLKAGQTGQLTSLLLARAEVLFVAERNAHLLMSIPTVNLDRPTRN